MDKNMTLEKQPNFWNLSPRTAWSASKMRKANPRRRT